MDMDSIQYGRHYSLFNYQVKWSPVEKKAIANGLCGFWGKGRQVVPQQMLVALTVMCISGIEGMNEPFPTVVIIIANVVIDITIIISFFISHNFIQS